MCGIVAACLVRGSVAPLLIAGLRRLEYRGYDSAGISLHAEGLPIRKGVPRVEDLMRAVAEKPLPEATVGIAHTRWASHGAPNEANAHPHRFHQIVLVHNGILENHAELKEGFVARGSSFDSETDSEVFAALIHDELHAAGASPSSDDFLAALRRAMLRAAGSFALAILHEALPEQVFFARREAPLLIGLGKGENFVASDVSALLSETRDFLYLEDGMYGYISHEDYAVFDVDHGPVTLAVEHVDWDVEQVGKAGYPHFMLKEIEEQPLVVAKALQSAWGDGAGFLEAFSIEDSQLAKFKRIVIVACGTALHAARYGKFVLEEACGLPVEVDFASEFRYRTALIGKGDLVLAISQSGETADTLGAFRLAIDQGATSIAICNVRGSSLCRLSVANVMTLCGPEIGVASTKAFMGQLVALHLLAMRIGRARGRLSQEEMEQRFEILRGLKTHLETLISSKRKDEIKKLAKKYHDKPIFFFLGRGADYPMALEGALKLKEISYVHAEGYPAGEMKHGPNALISDDMVIVGIAGSSPVHDKILSNLREVNARGGTLCVVTNPSKTEAMFK